MRRGFAAALGVGACCFSPRALAQAAPLPLALSWQAPGECPTGERIRANLARITRPRSGRQLAALTARATIAHDLAGYHLVLETEHEGALSRAQVDNPSCALLGRAATLMLALAYGDGAEVDAIEDRPPADRSTSERPLASASSDGPPKPRNASEPVRVVDESPKFADARSARAAKLKVAPWMAATVSSGIVAPIALGAEVGVEVGTPHWLGSFRVRAMPRTEATRRGSVAVRLSSTAIVLGGCAQAPIGALSLGGCASFSAGVLRASAHGAVHDGSASPAWFALSPSLLLEFHGASPWRVRLELGAQIPFSRPELVVEGEGVLYRTPRIAPELGLGLGLSF